MSLSVRAPLAGTVVALADVPDPVFAGAVVGAGLAIEPLMDAGEVVAVSPVTGTIGTIHPHAFVVVDAATGAGVLVHLGIDTVTLHGDGFGLHVAAGDQVQAGDAVITFDPSRVRAAGLSAVCPVVVFSSKAENCRAEAPAGTAVQPGDPLFDWTASEPAPAAGP